MTVLRFDKIDDKITAAVTTGILEVLADYKEQGRPIDHEGVMRGLTTAHMMFAMRTNVEEAKRALRSMLDVLETAGTTLDAGDPSPAGTS